MIYIYHLKNMKLMQLENDVYIYIYIYICHLKNLKKKQCNYKMIYIYIISKICKTKLQ